MKFEEIFNEDGQYTCDSFVEGFCLEIRDGMMFGIYYDHKDDLCPIINIFGCNKSMLKNDYRKVFTRQSLFKSGKIVTN